MPTLFVCASFATVEAGNYAMDATLPSVLIGLQLLVVLTHSGPLGLENSSQHWALKVFGYKRLVGQMCFAHPLI